MRRNLFGIILIVAGVIWALASFNLFDINLFVEGWWALLIIIFCACGLFTNKEKVGPCLGMGVGVLLYLAERDIIEWNLMGELALALCLIALGVKLIVTRGNSHHANIEKEKIVNQEGKEVHQIEVAFGSQKISFAGQNFEAADVKVSFGAAEIDLREAIIAQEAYLGLEAGFCGVRILVPEGLAVKVNAKCGFGGVQDKRANKVSEGSPVLYIQGEVGFSGVEINTKAN